MASRAWASRPACFSDGMIPYEVGVSAGTIEHKVGVIYAKVSVILVKARQETHMNGTWYHC